MIIVIFVIALALLVGSCIWYHYAPSDRWDITGQQVGAVICIVIGAVGIFVSVICSLCMVHDVVSLRIADEKIAMYQEENQVIETQIADVVEQYQKYEQDIFTEVSPESSMVLIATYPELKSDALVQQQIEIYTNNNQKIKELKEQKLNVEMSKWWLYFG